MQNLPYCIHFPKCGGCTTLDLPYGEQLVRKRTYLSGLFSRLNVEIPPIAASPYPLHYRHKVQLPFGMSGKGRERKLILGCYGQDSHTVVDQKQCLVQDRDLTAAAHAIRRWAQKSGLDAYNERTGSGFLRHVILRKGCATGEILIGLVTNGGRPAGSRNFAKSLMEEAQKGISANSRIVGVIQNINTRSTNVVLGQQEEVWRGSSFLKEKLGEYRFNVGISTFFQVNPFAAPLLYNLVLEQVPEGSAVLDVYCGVGTISLWVSQKASRVLGIEENPHSIREAVAAARNNAVNNVKFLTGDAAILLADRASGFDVAIVDPPRKGLEEKALESLKNSPVSKIIYVSCNPESLLRDIKMLSPHFHPDSLTGVDMFPHTRHVECVAGLIKNK
ncbi:MAG: 23S rRNA (uracil(1939)-C(5))-methyltransferase RlmD [Chitinispirillales bacterium]|jgi:23S rRNA (uracil1939-C5)-methyltransferase|nr:23S rRNA (uracil(1939)-C(5))-methyltransferase RlmD [Chitinispirillales bacterium]